MYKRSRNKRKELTRSWVMLVCLLVSLGLRKPAPLAAAGQAAERAVAAQEQSPAQIGSTVVILAETTDAPGRSALARFQALAQRANQYYALNSYGQIAFDVTFMDADGPEGSDDWYHVGASLAAYHGDRYGYGIAALAAAFVGLNLPEVVRLERAIVVYAGDGQLPGGSPCLASSTIWLLPDHYIEIAGAQRTARIYVPNLVFISEQEELGMWVHELGHTLSIPMHDGYDRIADRYDYGKPVRHVGYVGYWDLMGLGGCWGSPEGTSPTHMSSYTKAAAGWLCYRPAALNRDEELTSLENQQLGDAVLTVDDPFSDDPRDYYLLEARDDGVPFGAPESGVMIYHVTHDPQAGHAVVEILEAQTGEGDAQRLGRTFPRTTLHGANDTEGAREYTIPGGLVVKLVVEAFSPYKAAVRLSH